MTNTKLNENGVTQSHKWQSHDHCGYVCELFKLRHNVFMCTFVCMTKQCQISFNFTKNPPTPLKVKKLLQCSCHFGMVISPPPVGRITWPRDRNVARGRYYICAHQSQPIFSWVVAARFARCVGVRHCNGLWSHCIWCVLSGFLHQGRWWGGSSM